jgi:hypothetical protein
MITYSKFLHTLSCTVYSLWLWSLYIKAIGKILPLTQGSKSRGIFLGLCWSFTVSFHISSIYKLIKRGADRMSKKWACTFVHPLKFLCLISPTLQITTNLRPNPIRKYWCDSLVKRYFFGWNVDFSTEVGLLDKRKTFQLKRYLLIVHTCY